MRIVARWLLLSLFSSVGFTVTAQSTPTLLTESLRIGRGTVLDVEWHRGGEMVLVDTILGAWIYDDLLQDVAHVPDIRRATFSPDGSLLAGVNPDFTIGLWETETFTEVERLTGHSAEITALEWSPDGTLLASAGRDERLLLWDAATRTIAVDVLAGKLDLLQWSPRGTRIGAIDRENQTLRVWDSDGELVLAQRQTFGFTPTLPNGWWGITWRDESQVLVWSFSGEGTYGALFDAATNSKLEDARLYGATSTTYNPDGSRLALAGWGLGGVVVDLSTGEFVQRISPDTYTIAWNPDGRRVVGGDFRKNQFLPAFIYILDIGTGEMRYAQTDTTAIVRALWDSGGHKLISLSGDGLLTIWDGTNLQVLAEQDVHRQERAYVVPDEAVIARSDDGAIIAVADDRHAVHLWDTASGGLLKSLKAHRTRISKIQWQPNSSLLVTLPNQLNNYGYTENILVWDALSASDSPMATLPYHGPITYVNWQPDGQTLSTVDARFYSHWNIFDNLVNRLIVGDSTMGWYTELGIVQWSESGALAAAIVQTGSDGRLILWDRDANLILPEGPVVNWWETWPASEWRWTTDGSAVYVYGNGIQEGQQNAPSPEFKFGVFYSPATRHAEVGYDVALIGSNKYVQQSAISPDGYNVVGIHSDATGHLWDVRTPTAPIFTFEDILRAEWSPDGTLLAVLRDDGRALIYDTATLEITAQFAATPQARFYWSPDSRHIARHDSGVVFVYDVVKD